MAHAASRPHSSRGFFALLALVAGAGSFVAGQIGTPRLPLPSAPPIFDTAEGQKIRVVVLTKELVHPWGLAFLPDGSMLVTERPGRLRIIRNNVLDPRPIANVPAVNAVSLDGLMDVAVHPRFEENRFVYLTYSKLVGERSTAALARGRFDGSALQDVQELFVAQPNAGGTTRIVFGRDGTLYMTIQGAVGNRAQNPNDVAGKILRLRDDGTVPPDNPFVNRPGYRPEVFTMGNRSNVGIAVHPETGAIWATENGPNGGDEINVLAPGRNYGWPAVSYGRTYQGPWQTEVPWRAGMEQPLISWVPSIAASGIAFYTGDRFPIWKGNVFVGSMRTGEINRTGFIERIVFNARGEEMRREALLTELKKRFRDVRQGPDGLLYALAEDEMTGPLGEGAVLRIEPVPGPDLSDAANRNPGPAGAMGVERAILPSEPQVFDTAEQHKIRVSVVATGFSHPWAVTFLPNRDILVTERAGRLRIVRNGVLDPQPIAGVPSVQVVSLWGLMDTALHPKFAENGLLYLSYLKPAGSGRGATTAIARARFDGKALTDLKEIFVASPPAAGSSRLAFGLDGLLYMTTTADDMRAQDPNDLSGKILRLRDDGSVPPENPFVKRAGYRPEIFSLGHRSQVGIAVHPETGAVWSTEHGRQGGDEVNVILPGRNYGWPVVSYGRDYSGRQTSATPWQHGFEQPLSVWIPSIAITGIAFYTGDRFPAWKGNVFVGGLQRGRISRTGRLERIVFNRNGEEVRRESLLTEIKKRVRDVRQGPDGLLYVLVEDDASGATGGETALLRIEPTS
jgi:glucose/arabinose dehydrogenase